MIYKAKTFLKHVFCDLLLRSRVRLVTRVHPDIIARNDKDKPGSKLGNAKGMNLKKKLSNYIPRFF